MSSDNEFFRYGVASLLIGIAVHIHPVFSFMEPTGPLSIAFGILTMFTMWVFDVLEAAENAYQDHTEEADELT